MDSTLAPLIARESARPYFAYSSFYPAERAYTRMFNEIRYGEVLVPSPLLTTGSPLILLHFQIDPAGEFTSPQLPPENLRKLAEGHYTDPNQLAVVAERLAELKSHVSRDALADLPLEQPAPRDVVLAPPPSPAEQPGVQQAEEPRYAQQAQRNAAERQARNRAVQQMAQPEANVWNDRAWSGEVNAGVLQPLWLGDMLLLARRVLVGDQEYVQGCWLNWAEIDRALRAEVGDLFPNARLVSFKDIMSSSSLLFADGARELASMPICLVPGPPAVEPLAEPSPLRLSLWLAWICVVVAAGAVVVLLVGTVALSERRGAFVSAVTHELRTPLTTFRLYTEMLAEGMVPDEAKRRRYLSTLQSEALRLSHLVENVLAYARLERGRAPGRGETVGLTDLLTRVQPRLAERAAQAGLQLLIEPATDAAAGCRVRADPRAVEQILFNLVDNACKYAADADPRVMHLSAATDGRHGVLRVCDHGPGITPADARRLFRPFRKSARDAANSAPGVGLGLALSRRLARAMSGDLRLTQSHAGGACFELLLPLA
jgi:signal transduction histidine kinase